MRKVTNSVMEVSSYHCKQLLSLLMWTAKHNAFYHQFTVETCFRWSFPFQTSSCFGFVCFHYRFENRNNNKTDSLVNMQEKEAFPCFRRRLNWFSLSNEWVHWIAIDDVLISFHCLITSRTQKNAINDSARKKAPEELSSTDFRCKFCLLLLLPFLPLLSG